jgi:hypothetical protein
LERNRAVFYGSLRATINAILGTGRTVTLIGPVPELKFHLPNAMVKAMMRGEQRDFSQPFAEFAARQQVVLHALGELDKIAGVRVVYPHTALCDATTCRAVVNGMPLYFDDDHLGSYGTKAIESVLDDALNFSTLFDGRSSKVQ